MSHDYMVCYHVVLTEKTAGKGAYLSSGTKMAVKSYVK